MAGHNGYSNIPGYGLYDTTGATEDWTFWAAGGLSYTFEIGDVDFHPPYEVGVVERVPGSRGGRGFRQGREPGGLLRDAGRRLPRHAITR